MLGCNESVKNKEWLRRRRLRIEQVRKQSCDVAKQLRERMAWEDLQKAEEEKKLREKEFARWKVKKLSDLERKYRSSISEIGMGHRLASAEPDAEKIISQKSKINLVKAQERGKNAVWQEIKEKKEEDERKKSPIRRKKLTREIENIRSNLVCTLPKRDNPILRDVMETNIPEPVLNEIEDLSEESCPTPKKVFLPIKGQEFGDGHIKKAVKKKILKKKKRKSLDLQATNKNLPDSAKSKGSLSSKTKDYKSINSSLKDRPVKTWINLDTIKTPSVIESEVKSKSARTLNRDVGIQPSRENLVEFYNFPSRYYCKSYRECESLVEKIEDEPEADPVELAKHDEEEKIREENLRKENKEAVNERGIKALAKEKLKREYNDLIQQLEKLSKIEKTIKTNQRIPPPVLYMTDERIAEKANRRQRNMDSKFESIYHNVVESSKPAQNLSIVNSSFDGENYSEESVPQLNVAESPNLKTNSPASEENYETVSNDSNGPVKYVAKKTSRKKTKKDLIQNIEKTLAKSRKIRKEADRIVKSSSSESVFSSGSDVTLENSITDDKFGAEKNTSSSSSVAIDSVKIKIGVSENESGKYKQPLLLSCPRREKIAESPSKGQSNLWMYSGAARKSFLEDSLPLSASTCYRSPPSELHSDRVGQLLDFLSNLNHNQPGSINEKFQKDMEKLLASVARENRGKKQECSLNPQLTYYILKLLSMDREGVANLNVSSVSEISTPCVTDFESTFEMSRFSKTDDDNYNCGSSQAVAGSDSSHFSSTSCERPDESGSKIWRSILQKSTASQTTEILKTDKTFNKKNLEPPLKLPTPNKDNKYEKVTKKCLDRISDLSSRLEQVRKEQERLLSTSSGNSSFSFKLEKSPRKDKENEKEISKEKKGSEKKFDFRSPEKKPPFALEDFTNRYRLSPVKTHHLSTIPEADSQMQLRESLLSSSSSNESIPNIMEELFQRKILTSPFHYSGGESLSQTSSVGERVNKSGKKGFSSDTQSFKLQTEASQDLHFQSFQTIDSSFYSDKMRDLNSGRKSPDDSLFNFLEESSSEVMNHILSRIGLEWAKPLVKKKEDSKSLSTSSNSERKQSPNSCRRLDFEKEKSLSSKNRKKL